MKPSLYQLICTGITIATIIAMYATDNTNHRIEWALCTLIWFINLHSSLIREAR